MLKSKFIKLKAKVSYYAMEYDDIYINIDCIKSIQNLSKGMQTVSIDSGSSFILSSESYYKLLEYIRDGGGLV